MLKTDKSKFTEGTHNLYTAENLPETHKEFYERQKKNGLSSGDMKIPEFLEDHALVLYQAKEDKNYKDETVYSLETHPIVAVISENGTICRLRKEWKSSRYRFFVYHEQTKAARVLDARKKTRIIEEHIQEPNRIGVWSEKKLNDWIDYCDKYRELINSIGAKYSNIHETHLKTVQAFIDSLPDCTVRKQNGFKTFVDTDLFDIAFTHDKGVDYLRKEIKFKGTIEDITKIEQLLKN